MSAAGSIAGDAPIIDGDAGRRCTVVLPADYIQRLTAIAAIPSDTMFAFQAPQLPHSLVATWGTEYATDGAKTLRGPIESVIVGASVGVHAQNDGAPFGGVSDNGMAMACIAEDFYKDLIMAVKGVTEKYNRMMAEFADNAGVPNYVKLTKSDTIKAPPNYKTRQSAIAALKVKLTGGVPIEEAAANQSRGAHMYQLTHLQTEGGDDEEIVYPVARKKQGKVSRSSSGSK